MTQRLSQTARRAKLARDKTAAMTSHRRIRKAENQRLGQQSDRDIHHKSDGTIEKVSISNNRGNFGRGTKKE